jgi:hypothetical protein
MFTPLQFLGLLIFWAAVAAAVIRVALAAFTGTATCVKMKRFLMLTIKGMVASLLVIGLAGYVRSFRPPDRVERPNPVEPGNRLFAVKEGFVDISIDVRASDWPYTFSRPFTVGDAWWPEVYAQNRFYWSKDGSVIVWRTRRHRSPAAVYERAYDYLKHEALEPTRMRMTGEAFDRKIAELLRQRGGVGQEVTGLPHEK